MEFVDTFTQLREVAQIVRKCPTATLKRAFINAARDFAGQSHWLRMHVSMSTTDIQSGLDGDYEINLDGNEAQYLEVVGIRDDIIGIDTSGSQEQEFRIRPGDESKWRMLQDPSQPRYYAYKPEGMFNLTPPPDITYLLRITAVVQPQDGAERMPSDLFKRWSTPIQAGALEYLLMLPGQPWTDKSEAVVQGKVFRAGINNAKADAQRRFNTGSQRMAPRRFVRI
jgi:hypothetical protein